MRLPDGERVPPDAVRITGITDDMLAKDGAPFGQAYQAFLDLLRGQLEGAEPGAYLLLVGHNIKSARLPACLPERLPACLPACLPARLPACLPT